MFGIPVEEYLICEIIEYKYPHLYEKFGQEWVEAIIDDLIYNDNAPNRYLTDIQKVDFDELFKHYRYLEEGESVVGKPHLQLILSDWESEGTVVKDLRLLQEVSDDLE